MDLELNDTERLLRDTFRGWFTAELAPAVPAMEDGSELPYGLMRRMHRALGLEADFSTPVPNMPYGMILRMVAMRSAGALEPAAASAMGGWPGGGAWPALPNPTGHAASFAAIL